MLIKTFILCLAGLGIKSSRLQASLRVHHGVSIKNAQKFWSTITGLPKTQFTRVEIVDGKKKGKLIHGMCRVRVKSGIRERLLIQSAISHLAKAS